ncbi:MAG: DUF5107 domain-containing protein [Bacteroidaceae bacterium]|nr:DUF5107 domain-containing protein [Bacteroidaceae bacterium]
MVKAWREQVVIPTYEVGAPEKNPIFLEKRVYQGSSGVVYPYPVIESISDERIDKVYNAIYIENEYIKVMILPELGGRVQMAYDKVKQRHFVYYNHVIKPALVGLAGPWISGGIEFNWPQHHRPSTYMPVDATIEENEDGSVTVWVNEMERMFHQKGLAGFTLRPGCAYLEIQGRLSNRTPLPQTFLWWANPAVEVNDHYQSVFPPDVNAVFDHGKRAVSSFPIATGTYYKMDYSAGVDISNYKNIKVPTSYMAVNSKYDFEGGYENDTKGGMLHVASHHFSPGKKQWTWGNGDFGRAWDRCLTDDDYEGAPGVFRPYIELMAGVYTENQPDFTWLMPYEEKQFTQYFMPYRDLGIVKQATKDLVMNIEECDSGVVLKLLATSKKKYTITLRGNNGKVYYNQEVNLSPEDVFVTTIGTDGLCLKELGLHITPCDKRAGEGGIFWTDESDDIRPIPDAAEAALTPQDTKTIDQLYLTGLHLEQYRHATWSALDYYEEALRRDPLDYRCNNQMGLWYLRRGRFDKAEPYLRTAVKVLQKRNPNPYDGEPIYNLALCMKYQSKRVDAYNLFWKATWNKAWADAAYFEAACISTGWGEYANALDEVNRCLICNTHNHKARALKATILRKLGKKEEALAWIKESYEIDPFNYGCMFEEHLLTSNKEHLHRLVTLMHDSIENYHELALDYANAYLYDEAGQILRIPTNASPLTHYYTGSFLWRQAKEKEALESFNKAENTCSDYCFPNRLEDIIALEDAELLNPKGARAPYYLGCLYYDKRQYDEALKYWTLSAERDPDFPTVWRNLALIYCNKKDYTEKALELMERAFTLNQTDSRIFMELDQLYKRMQKPHDFRLAKFESHPELVAKRDDLILEHATLLNQTGDYERAAEIIDNHIFHPWEGGEGKVPAQYQFSRTERAKAILRTNPTSTNEAISLLTECLAYPHNLGEGKLHGAQENDFHYFLGCAYEQLGDTESAHHYWELATHGPQEPAAAMYYNDAKPEKIFYQGMALLKLGRTDEANGRFYRLVNYGKQHIFEKQTMDYFAVSLPDLLIWEDSLDRKNRIHCLFMLALGYTGLGEKAHAERYLKEVEEMDINHLGVQALRSFI